MVKPALVGFGDDLAINAGLAGDVAADLVVAVANVDVEAFVIVVVNDGVVCGRRLRSSLSFSEMTEDDDDELLA